MALKLSKKNERRITVTATEPVEGGGSREHQFGVKFKILPNRDLLSELKDGERLIVDLLSENILDMDGLQDEAGEPLTYSDDIKAAVLEVSWLVSAVWQAFLAVQNGMTDAAYKKALAKN